MSGESVLVMDWIEGIPLSNRERLEEVGADRAGLARAILQAYGVMIFQSDRFHADPHPGNLIAIKGERLGLIDFGEVGSVEPAERTALLRMMTAVLGRDGEALVGAVLSVSRTTRTVDRTEFGAQLATLLDPVADASLKDVRLGETLGRLLHLLRNYGIVLPSDLAVLIKTMIECEATTNELDPTMSMLNLVGELCLRADAPNDFGRDILQRVVGLGATRSGSGFGPPSSIEIRRIPTRTDSSRPGSGRAASDPKARPAPRPWAGGRTRTLAGSFAEAPGHPRGTRRVG